MTQNYQEKSIPLITIDPKTRNYIPNEEAMRFVSSVPTPIAVIAVAGMYRTGKSYLLNRMLLNRSDGFGVGPTINPCTKGLWIWSTPIKGQTSDGENVNILVIDSEGIGALDQDSSGDNKIFALTVLLSSCFIYNSVGSIDENAIQNLSLVVNLTKNIHVKSGNQNVDTDDYAMYFPSFVWVVRDFTLQLVDNNNNSITSKDYLERALAPHKGISDLVENKNRIRRLLTTFFKERDCVTMVRPLTSEEKLQSLDKMDMDKLRPEFFEQVVALRKKLLNRIRIKTMNNKHLTGEMFSGLVRSYSEAINKGAVPNIESAWTYICRNECMKAVQDSIDIYDKGIKDIMQSKLPVLMDELKIYHKTAKEKALKAFKFKAVGDESEQFLKEFRDKLKESYNKLIKENEKESMEFITIEQKLKNREYNSFFDFDRDLKLFYSYFMENGPKTEKKEVIILEFIQKYLGEGASYFMRTQKEEVELQKMLQKELNKKYEKDLQESKEDSTREKSSLMKKIAALDSEKSDFDLTIQNYKLEVDKTKRSMDNLEKQLKNEHENNSKNSQKIVADLKKKLNLAEEGIKEFERQNIISQSEFEKEKALFVQKTSYLEKNLEESQKKEKEQANEIKNFKKENVNQIKEISNKHEAANKQLSIKLSDLQEKLLELDNELSSKEQKFEIDRKKWLLNETHFTKVNTEANQTIQSLQEEIKELRASEQKTSDLLKKETEKNAESLQSKISLLEAELKTKDELIKSLKNQISKDQAVHVQKMEFLEVQLKEYKNQMTENKKAHDSILTAFEANQSNEKRTQSTNKQIGEIKENHNREIKNLQTEFENSKKRMQDKIQQLTEKNNELELKYKFENNDLQKEIEDLKDQLEGSELARNKLTENNKNLDGQKIKMVKDSEERYLNKIRQLELALEDQKARSAKEANDYSAESELSLNQLKNFYEIERERLEKRVLDEKSRYEKKLAQQNEDFEIKLKEEQNNYEEEIENLKEELHDQEMQNQQLIQQYEHELSLKAQSIENLQKYVKEAKENLANEQKAHNLNIEQQQQNFTEERQVLLVKFETTSTELANKEKELLSASHKNEFLETMVNKKEALIDSLKTEYLDERAAINERLEEARNKYQNLADEFLERKIEFSRDVALSKQQNEFLNKKIEDLYKQNEELTTRFEEKMASLKSDFSQDQNEKCVRLMNEKDAILVKYEKIKKNFKELESSSSRTISQLEIEKSSLNEKVTALESKNLETEVRLNSGVKNLKMQLEQLKESNDIDKKSLTSEIEKYRSLNLQIESEKSELMTNYEKDRVLWEGKFEFLNEQKDQAKGELDEAVKKFDVTLGHLKRAKNNQELEKEETLNDMMNSMKKKHSEQINTWQENHKRSVDKYEEKILRLEEELKKINDQLLLDNHGRMGKQAFSEKKLAEVMENEKRLNEEIENVKKDRDSKILEYQEIIDKERETLKEKIEIVEKKQKESEMKRTALLFQHEKDRAKWNLEKDHLNTEISDLQDNIEKIEKKKENLMRENEKLKSQLRDSNKKNTTSFSTSTKNIKVNQSMMGHLDPGTNQYSNYASKDNDDDQNDKSLKFSKY